MPCQGVTSVARSAGAARPQPHLVARRRLRAVCTAAAFKFHIHLPGRPSQQHRSASRRPEQAVGAAAAGLLRRAFRRIPAARHSRESVAVRCAESARLCHLLPPAATPAPTCTAAHLVQQRTLYLALRQPRPPAGCQLRLGNDHHASAIAAACNPCVPSRRVCAAPWHDLQCRSHCWRRFGRLLARCQSPRHATLQHVRRTLKVVVSLPTTRCCWWGSCALRSMMIWQALMHRRLRRMRGPYGEERVSDGRQAVKCHGRHQTVSHCWSLQLSCGDWLCNLQPNGTQLSVTLAVIMMMLAAASAHLVAHVPRCHG
jgi:hypothetical protein